ncbi:MAG TPA: ferredoxin [Microbacteriaceae bacterium]|jgi:sarcosine oxidase subunit alpha|nr:ferredoxin [Microbacteriaceae bacterium]
MTARRLPTGGAIDRSTLVTFRFGGVDYSGFAGDTLASALLGAGVDSFGLSVRLGRPRGVVSAGAEESSALVQVDEPFPEPMLLATTIELTPGLAARGLTGQGVLATTVDPARYDARHAHTDILVVGAGPAGLSAALVAARSGARVILVDDDSVAGGSLLDYGELIDGEPGSVWAATAVAELATYPRVRVLSRTTAFGIYDDGFVLAIEHRADHAVAAGNRSRQRVWRIRTKQIVIATGGYERPIAFANNDLPGVMLASSALAFLHRYAVLAGDDVVVFTTNDTAYGPAIGLADAGARVTVVDTRATVSDVLEKGCRHHGVTLLLGQAVEAALGDIAVRGVQVVPWRGDGSAAPVTLDCDLLLVSGGWNPVLHLFSQARGVLRFDESLATFVADGPVKGVHLAGLAAAQPDLAAALASGARAGRLALAELGIETSGTFVAPAADSAFELGAIEQVWFVAAPASLAEPDVRFVDVQRDVTVSELLRATGAGLRSMEHVKRYTTLGTALDQGKTSGVIGSGVVAAMLGIDVTSLGTTTFRPPFTPVAFGALAGTDRGSLYDPIRLTAIHDWHVANGAVFEDVGQWKRPWYYPLEGESLDDAVARECTAARTAVACLDGSTLGKIDVQGPDAGAFLDMLYTNLMSSLKINSIRYGVMCSPDGMVKDDGTVIRLADDHFIVTTTTGNAATILDWMEEWLQTEWPEMRVCATSVTEHWVTVPLVGPLSRRVLAVLAPDLDVSIEGFPFMATRDATIAGIAGRVDRISFSGELAYELNVPSWYGLALWEAIMAAGAQFAITPYGTETMHVLRAEKGYPIIGQDTDGTVTPQDLGLGWAVSRKKLDFIGKRSFARAINDRTDRKQFVALLPVDPAVAISEGAQVIESSKITFPMPMLGHVSSAYRSVALDSHFALALVKGGRDRIGDRLFAWSEGSIIPVTVADPVLYDPEGTRRDG